MITDHDIISMGIKHHRLWITEVIIDLFVNGTFWLDDAVLLLIVGGPLRGTTETESQALRHSVGLEICRDLVCPKSQETSMGRYC